MVQSGKAPPAPRRLYYSGQGRGEARLLLNLNYELRSELCSDMSSLRDCYLLNVCAPPPFTCGNLIPNVIVFGDGEFGRWLGHGATPSWMGFVLSQKDPMMILHHVTIWQKTSHPWTRKWALTKLWIYRYLDLGLPRFQNSENEYLLFVRHLVHGSLFYGIFVIAAWWPKTGNKVKGRGKHWCRGSSSEE